MVNLPQKTMIVVTITITTIYEKVKSKKVKRPLLTREKIHYNIMHTPIYIIIGIRGFIFRNRSVADQYNKKRISPRGRAD